MNKKGQVTIFIIVGIVLLIAFSLIFFLKVKITSSVEDTFRTNTESIEYYIKNCIKISAEESIMYTASQGGYANTKEPLYNFYWREIPYYMYENENTMPSKQTIEEEISRYIDYRLPLCLSNLTNFEEQGYDIEIGEPESKTIIALNDVFTEVNYPIEIKKGDFIKRLGRFNTKIPVRLGKIYDVIYNLTEEQVADPNYICLSCMTEKCIENDFEIKTTVQERGTIVYILIDENSKINDLPYMIVYAYKYET